MPGALVPRPLWEQDRTIGDVALTLRLAGPVYRASTEASSRGQRDRTGVTAAERARRCGDDPTNGKTAGAARAEHNIARKRQAREWDEQHGKLVDLSAFQHDILPLIQDVPLSRLRKATGLSLRYVSLIRRVERTPHPRHWQAFLAAMETEGGAH